jgi:hypothetical protein
MIEFCSFWVAGLLFLNGDTKSLMTLVSGLKNASEQELEVVPIRHVAVLSSLGYLCTPQSMAEILQSRMSMVIFLNVHLAALAILGSHFFSCSMMTQPSHSWFYDRVLQVFVV